MVLIENKEDCCGCGACVAVCPIGCMEMRWDEEGFSYPWTDTGACIQCGKCEQVCQYKQYMEPNYGLRECYVGRIKDKELLRHCASGGVYTAIAKDWVIAGGLAVGAEARDGHICHTIIRSDESDVIRHSSSKYIQSNTVDAYREVEKLLREGKHVLYSGTPCQVVGLKALLNHNYSNLYTIEVLCAGVMSPMLFEAFVALKEKRHSSKMNYFNMRWKAYGYHSFVTRLGFVSGRITNNSRLTDEMMHVYTERMGDRPSCSKCRIKGVNRISDLTLFDCWHFSELTGLHDDDKGYTSVIVHSEKGRKLLLSCDLLWTKKIELEEAIRLDGNMVNGRLVPHHRRDMFYSDLREKGLRIAIQNNCPITIKNKVLEGMKPFLYRVKLLDFCKTIMAYGRKKHERQ